MPFHYVPVSSLLHRPRLLDACRTTQQAVNQHTHENWSQKNNFGPSWTFHSQLKMHHILQYMLYTGVALDSAFDKAVACCMLHLLYETEREGVLSYCRSTKVFVSVVFLDDETLNTVGIDMRCPHIPSWECCSVALGRSSKNALRDLRKFCSSGILSAQALQVIQGQPLHQRSTSLSIALF